MDNPSHGPVGLIGKGAEVGVNPGDQVLGHELAVRATAGPAHSEHTAAASTATAGSVRATAGKGRVGAAGSAGTASHSPHSWAGHHAAANRAGFHYDNEGLGFARSDQVVHDQMGIAHLRPHPLVLTATVLDIEDRVAGGVLFVSRRRIDEDAAPAIVVSLA